MTLLGDFSVADADGNVLSLPTRKSVALLAYLAVQMDRPQPRERLKAMLWSDRDEQRARQSLNHALLSIRRLSGPDAPALLDSNGEQVTLRGEAVDIDVVRMRALLDSRPMEAAALYSGPFLDGLTVPDPVFENWLGMMRSDIHTQLCDALEQGIAAAEENDDDGMMAMATARQLIRLDPVRESGHQHLMRLLYERGDRASAIRQYRECADILAQELAVEPGAATRALFEAVSREDAAPVAVETPAAAEAPLVTAATLPLREPVGRQRRFALPALAVLSGLVIGAGVMSLYHRTETHPPDLSALVEENARVLAETIHREANLESERARIAALTLERAVEAAQRQAAETARQHAEGVIRKHTIENARRQADELLRQAQEAAAKQVAEIVRRAEVAAIAKAEKAVAQSRTRQQSSADPPSAASQSDTRATVESSATDSGFSVGSRAMTLAVDGASGDDRDDSVHDIGSAAETWSMRDGKTDGSKVARSVTARSDKSNVDSRAIEEAGIVARKGLRSGRRGEAASVGTGEASVSLGVRKGAGKTVGRRAATKHDARRIAILAAITSYYFIQGYPSEATGAGNDVYYGWDVPDVRLLSVRKTQSGDVEVSVEYPASVVNNYQAVESFKKGRLLLRERKGEFAVLKSWSAS